MRHITSGIAGITACFCWGAAVLAAEGAPAAPGGWPILVPGAVTGSPTPVDLDGDGKPEIVMPYMGMIRGTGGDGSLSDGREPDYAARVGAFHLDGTPVTGFPLTIMTAEHHKAAQPSEFPNWWLSTPAVLDAH